MSERPSMPPDPTTPPTAGAVPPVSNDSTSTTSSEPASGSTGAHWTMPGSDEQAARAIERVGPEGRPSVPHAGPTAIWAVLALIVVGVIAASAAAAIWVGWAAAAAIVAIALLALAFNPAMYAAAGRASDRQRVIEGRGPDEPKSPDPR